MNTRYFQRMDSPIGTLTLAADAAGLRHIEFPTNRHPVDRAGWVPGTRGAIAETLATARAQLLEYFAGARRTFALPLAPEGTPFQREVWTMLARIPWGATWSYGQLAKAIGQPAAVRAVSESFTDVAVSTAISRLRHPGCASSVRRQTLRTDWIHIGPNARAALSS